jgi:hypothetical protein
MMIDPKPGGPLLERRQVTPSNRHAAIQTIHAYIIYRNGVFHTAQFGGGKEKAKPIFERQFNYLKRTAKTSYHVGAKSRQKICLLNVNKLRSADLSSVPFF